MTPSQPGAARAPVRTAFHRTVLRVDGGWIRARLADARLYLCTGLRPDLAEFADATLASGVDMIQLREKGPDGPVSYTHLTLPTTPYV